MIAFAILPCGRCQTCRVVEYRDRGWIYHDGQAYATGDQSLDYTICTVFECKERRKRAIGRANYLQSTHFSTLTLASRCQGRTSVINTQADPKLNTVSLSHLTSFTGKIVSRVLI